MRLLGLFFLFTAGAAFAGEYAVLASGSRLHVEGHEIDGARVRLYNNGGYTEIASAEVRAFEAEEYVAPPPQAALPVAVTPPALSLRQLADAAADKYSLPRRLVHSVIKAESGFQPQAVSAKGAIGLMQLMPSTAKDLGANPRDPAQNVDAGTRYLRNLLDRYHGGLWHALAAYNAGPGAVDKHNGVPPYRETINYVQRISAEYSK